MSPITETLKAAVVAAPTLEAAVVAQAVAEQFDLSGDYRLLVSERDQNFRLTTVNDERYVVKVTSLAEDPVATDFQIAALLHLEGGGFSGAPRIVRSTSGADCGSIQTTDGKIACLRIVTWLDGDLLDDSELTADIVSNLGGRLAELDRALEGFSHEGDAQVLLWDTQRFGELRDLLIHVDDLNLRQELESVLNDFDRIVKPALASLPSQVIHNDAHGANILLGSKGDISGIIDFGDMLRAPRVIEISTAAAYLRPTGDDPLQFIVPFVAAYQQQNPLSGTDIDLVFDLVRARLTMTIIILYWRLTTRDEDDPYRQKQLETEGDALADLRSLTHLGREAFCQQISDL